MNDVTSMRRRRKWSDAEKRAIISEARQPGCTIAGVARRHGIQPSLVFGWQRQTEGIQPSQKRLGQVDSSTEIRDQLLRIRELEGVESIVRDKLITELRKGRTGACGAANAFCALTNAVSKLHSMKFELLGRFDPVVSSTDTAILPDEIPIEEQRMAEILCLELVREQVRIERESKGL